MSDHACDLDVAILGGGLAGCAAGILLARAGFRTTIFEASRHPKHHIGESLLPASLPILERLGVSRADLTRFQPKFGARFFDPARGVAGELETFCFPAADDLPPSYQVLRSEFDAMMMARAQESGCKVIEECAVTDIDEDAGVLHAGSARHSSRFIIDATGRRGLIASKRKTRIPLPDFGRIAVFNYFAGMAEHDDRDADFITMYVFIDRARHHAGGWWWCIPLADGRMSVGVVMQRGAMIAGLTAEEQFYAQAERMPQLMQRLGGARPTEAFRTEADYSFRVTEKSSERFALVGDAAGFLDPIFSSGVHLGLVSAEAAAEGIIERLKEGKMDRLHAYERKMNQGFEVFRAFVQRFYNGGLLDLFFQPEKPPEFRDAIISILAGHVWDEKNIVVRMLTGGAAASVAVERGAV